MVLDDTRKPSVEIRHAEVISALTCALEGSTKELMQTRCDRGAQIAISLDLPMATADAIRGLDEHWDGRGGPAGTKGRAIPLLARIAGLAQTVEVFVSSVGETEAFDMARKRIGVLHRVAELAACHHERLDGKGYYRGLTGDALSLSPVV